MKALEFKTQVNPDHTLSVPPDLAAQLPSGQDLRVLLLIADTEEEQAWEQTAALEFGQGYAESDAIYDQFSGR